MSKGYCTRCATNGIEIRPKGLIVEKRGTYTPTGTCFACDTKAAQARTHSAGTTAMASSSVASTVDSLVLGGIGI